MEDFRAILPFIESLINLDHPFEISEEYDGDKIVTQEYECAGYLYIYADGEESRA